MARPGREPRRRRIRRTEAPAYRQPVGVFDAAIRAETTVELDPGRHRTAIANFKEAGLAPYIDARLGNAHEIVPALPGPFDFVFSDADKEWYKNYLVAVWPKLLPGGCVTAHNVSGRGRARESVSSWRISRPCPMPSRRSTKAVARGSRSAVNVERSPRPRGSMDGCVRCGSRAVQRCRNRRNLRISSYGRRLR